MNHPLLKKALTALSLTGLVIWTSSSFAAVTIASVIGTTPAGTEISSQAFADYEDSNGNPSVRVQSNIVTTVVSTVAGVFVNPPTSTVIGAADTTSSFAFQVLNIGNTVDSFDVSQTNTAPVGWTVEIVEDTNADGLWDPTEITVVSVVEDIAPGESVNFHLLVTTTGAVDDDEGIFTVLASSQTDDTQTSSGIYTLDVQAAVIVLQKRIIETPTYLPGDVVTYEIATSNTGSAPVTDSTTQDEIPSGTTYVPGSMRSTPIGSSYDDGTPLTDADDAADTAKFDPTANSIFIGPGDLDPGVVIPLVMFQVTIDDDQVAGTTISNVATENYNGKQTSSNTANFSVAVKPGTSIAPPSQSQDVEPGQEVSFFVDVTNEGNATDTINLKTVSPSGFTWVLYFDDSGAASGSSSLPLMDTNGDGLVDTGPIVAGATIDIIAITTIPEGLTNGSEDETILTASSVAGVDDPNTSSSAMLISRVETGVIVLFKSVSPTGDQPPATTLTYTVTATNNGSATAYQVKILDQIPEWTTYQAGTLRTAINAGVLTARSDENDGDGATFYNALFYVETDPINIGPTGTVVLEFQVTID
jgi:trimeric autotransporter adhesin